MIRVQVRKGTEDKEGSRKKGLKIMRVQVKGAEDNEGYGKKALKMLRAQARRDRR
jgi:tRNA(Met) C34 N-acetyltransferase TmcA